MVAFKDYFPGLLPNSIIDRDSYKDVDGKGFVERFLGAFGTELDDNQSLKLEQISKLYEPMAILELQGLSTFDPTFDFTFGGPDINIPQYLDNFAIALGDVPRFLTDDRTFARFLTYLISIWKVKGTKKSYKALLTVLGHLDVLITETIPVEITYDADPPILYDADPTALYDVNCATCSDYQIVLETNAPLTGEEYRKLWELIYLIEPIGAHLSKVIWGGITSFDPTFDPTFGGGIEVIHTLIEITVDDNGDLVYSNPDDLGLVLEYLSGELVITSSMEDRYFISNGLLYFIIY